MAWSKLLIDRHHLEKWNDTKKFIYTLFEHVLRIFTKIQELFSVIFYMIWLWGTQHSQVSTKESFYGHYN